MHPSSPFNALNSWLLNVSFVLLFIAINKSTQLRNIWSLFCHSLLNHILLYFTRILVLGLIGILCCYFCYVQLQYSLLRGWINTTSQAQEACVSVSYIPCSASLPTMWSMTIQIRFKFELIHLRDELDKSSTVLDFRMLVRV